MRFLIKCIFAGALLPILHAQPDQAKNDAGVAKFEIPKNGRHLAALEHFLTMPPEKLARIRKTIERIEAMDEAEKEALLANIREFREKNPDREAGLLRQFQRMPLEERMLLRRYFLSIPPEKAMQLRRRLMRADSEQRQIIVEEILSVARDLPEVAEPGSSQSRRSIRRQMPAGLPAEVATE